MCVFLDYEVTPIFPLSPHFLKFQLSAILKSNTILQNLFLVSGFNVMCFFFLICFTFIDRAVCKISELIKKDI